MLPPNRNHTFELSHDTTTDDATGKKESDPKKTHISEETFVSTLLSSGKLSASPDELAAAYGHAAGGVGSGGSGRGNSTDHRMLTLEHLAAFTTYSGPHIGDAAGGGGHGGGGGGGGGGGDWASWMSAARPGDGGVAARRALVKARVKCRDAGLLGRSFPGEAFSRLDPEGGGRVSRPAFKRALREMGFALVDEPAPEGMGSEGQGALANGNTAPWSASEAGLGTAADVRCILGGMLEDNPAYDGEEVRLRRVEGDGHDEARRNAFQEKVKEIERAAAEKVSELNIYIYLVFSRDWKGALRPNDGSAMIFDFRRSKVYGMVDADAVKPMPQALLLAALYITLARYLLCHNTLYNRSKP